MSMMLHPRRLVVLLGAAGLITGIFIVNQQQTKSNLNIPIITYHEILDSKEMLWADIQITTEEFENDLLNYRENGYTTVTFEDIGVEEEGIGELPEKPIILTFDDTHVSLYENAFRILQEHNMKGVFFINSGWVGLPGNLTWDQIREMRSEGMEIGGHTVDHVELTEVLSDDELLHQISVDKQTIEHELGERIISFSYPANTVIGNAVSVLKDAGYFFARTGENGEEGNRYKLESTVVTQ